MAEEVEIWKDVVGYEGFYQVSNLGRVKSLHRYFNRIYCNGTNIQREVPERILPLRDSIKKYSRAFLCKGRIKKNFLVHRLVAVAFIANPENKLEVNHINCNKKDNRVSNLEWTSYSENRKHAVENGRMRYALGEKSGSSKLSESQIKEIRLKHKNGETGKNIAMYFNVTPSTIYSILNNITWKHVI